ncbi:TonB-dependent receptor [Colwellia sp. MSW7]|uniref:TonB-dependent receptor n=1 Tax=Colwellia maritima TaxID=2912588 RepID=A0ABS9X384_9GAMM|nr:TonB-dependent receptor [Colwellia maritima]MCI2283532.1 TonB-dependent receptor [Colwellia maritima]
MFNKKILTTSILAALSSMTVATMGYAAEDEAKDVEIITVTGIRGSLLRAMDVKRSSDGIVDAISAEDMGKFPDTNLAESLQRITGVSIDRASGEGSKVTVRGFGADKNLITLNGRQLPTTTGDRTFDFANIASESVSGVTVYKTSNASVTSGGIGATIDLQTHKPLQSPGTKASFGTKFVNDSSTDQGSTTPEISGLYSQTFADEKFGISLSGSYQERESGMQQFFQDQGYRASDYSNTGWGGVPAGADGGTNRPTSGNYSNPQQPRYVFEERQRERVNGQLVLQFKPIENLTTTLDYTLIRNTVEEQHTDASVWFNYAGDRSESVWDGSPNAVPLIYSEIYEINSDADFADTSLTVGSWGNEQKTDSIGLNIDWQVNDDLNLVLDHHSSKASMQATDPRHGTRNNLQLPSYTRTRTGLDLTGDLPGIATGNIESFTPETMRLSGIWFANDKYSSEIQQTQVKGEYVINDEVSIDFGVSVNTVNNHYRHTQVQRADWGGVGVEGDFADINWREDTILDKFDAKSGNFEGTPTQSDYDLFNTIYFADFDEIIRAAEFADPVANVDSLWGDCKAPAGASAGPNGEGHFCASTNWDADTNRFTEEKTTAYFTQVSYISEINDMPFSAFFGLRYETTDVDSKASAPGYSSIEWNEDTATSVTGVTGIESLHQSADYSQLLPSISVNLELTDDIVLRAAAGKTISRASYNQLQGGTTVNTGGSLSGYSGNSGNPALKPLESINFDVSAEYYYDEGSYVSLGYFRKDVTNWITTGTVDSAIFNLPNPLDGEKFRAATAALGANASNQEIRDYIFTNYADDPNVQPNFDEDGLLDGGKIIGDPTTDNIANFRLNVPVNGDNEETIDGIEFNVQHIFGDSGFGGIFNYTLTDSGLAYDNNSLQDTAALTGLSDTANIVAFYDKDGIQARIAYNWRDEFLNERRVNGDLTAPIYTEAYSQIDFNVSYDVAAVEGLTVFIEGINITNEYGRDTRLTYKLTQTGARYAVGARFSF